MVDELMMLYFQKFVQGEKESVLSFNVSDFSVKKFPVRLEAGRSFDVTNEEILTSQVTCVKLFLLQTFIKAAKWSTIFQK